MIHRLISANLKNLKKSALILGPRQAGKSTLIQSLKPDLTIQLADEMEYYTFTSNFAELRTRIESQSPRTIFIDEVQRIPGILNTVQALIDANKKLKFYLTGSSARKLKRGGANLLPGRVLNFHLGPLVASELDYQLDTRRALIYGTLPEIYLDNKNASTEHLLRSYASNYLKEEIKAEALIRNLEAFSRFMNYAWSTVGVFIDYSKIARQAKIPRHSISRFYEIFEDTLIGQRIWPFEPLREKADLIKHPKFYLFDNGVLNAALGNFQYSPDRAGPLAEQLIFNQILHSSWAKTKEARISTFRTRGGLEVDFIVELEGETIAIEVKTSDHVLDVDVSPLNQFRSHFPRCKRTFVWHLGKKRLKLGSTWCLPWQEGLREIGV
jgi:predicted AAA+ superfamily ATPase